MSFVSLEFFLFLPLVFALHYLGRTVRWQNAVCVAASYFFYGWWDYRFCGLLLASSVIDFWAGRRLGVTRRPRGRQALLWLSLATNLGALGFFKYFDFFVDSLVVGLAAAGLDVGTSTLRIVLPVGISFYTFQTMSYTIDVYRRRIVPETDFVAYLAYVSFFPQLVAGPIERAERLLPQFKVARVFAYAEAVQGCQLMLWGLFKKMVVADNLGAVVDQAYASPGAATAPRLAWATLCFAFQIYGDFSGYSDIAAGTARLFGVRLVRNFHTPYFSRSVAEFWRRWHISLSTWFRDYVYIPLGGNRRGPGLEMRNLWVTFLLSGLWHGAAWTFILWGALHALWMTPRHAFFRKRDRRGAGRNGATMALKTRPGVWRVVPTFGLICVAWVLFRADSAADAFLIYGKLSSGLCSTAFYAGLIDSVRESVPAVGFVAVLLGFEWNARGRWNVIEFPAWPRWLRWSLWTALFWCILFFGTRRTEEFIYFRF